MIQWWVSESDSFLSLCLSLFPDGKCFHSCSVLPLTVNTTAVLLTVSLYKPLSSPLLSSPLLWSLSTTMGTFIRRRRGGRPEHERHVIGQEAGTTLTWLAVGPGAVSRVPSLFQRASVSSGVGLAVLEMHTRYFCLFWFLWLRLPESRQKTLYGSSDGIDKLLLELSQKI